MKKMAWLLFCVLATGALADPQGKAYGWHERYDVDRVEEEVPGRPDLSKVTFIFRNQKAKPAPALAQCSCPGGEGSAYSLEKVRWNAASLPFTVYTAASGLGSEAGQAVVDSFMAWNQAAPAAPQPQPSQDSSSPAPAIAYDSLQAVSWQPLSAEYGASTLAVTVYWYSRVKVRGVSQILHFDMAFNTDYSWTLAGLTESCGGGEGFDVRDVGTHEAGHAYGLAHNNDCNLTMNPTAGPGETLKSSLASGDINGIRSLY